MRIRIRKKGPVSLLHVVGKLTIPRETQLRTVVNDLLDAGERLYVLDMTHCPYLDSAGLGETVAVAERIHERQGRIVLVLTGKSRSLFEITRLTDAFEIYRDEQEALASFIPRRRAAPVPALGSPRVNRGSC